MAPALYVLVNHSTCVADSKHSKLLSIERSRTLTDTFHHPWHCTGISTLMARVKSRRKSTYMNSRTNISQMPPGSNPPTLSSTNAHDHFLQVPPTPNPPGPFHKCACASFIDAAHVGIRHQACAVKPAKFYQLKCVRANYTDTSATTLPKILLHEYA